jgi:hypothetical protein
MYLGAEIPAVIAQIVTDGLTAFLERQFKRSLTEVASGWSALCELALDRADEAERLWLVCSSEISTKEIKSFSG